MDSPQSTGTITMHSLPPKPKKYWDCVSKEEHHEEHMRFGAAMGWWERWDEVGPFKTITVKAADFQPHETMAHVMVKTNQFKSVGEARNAGWNKPISVGEHLLKKRRVYVKVL